MNTATIYRIYTEKKNHREIVRLAGSLFESFTLQPTSGYYQGKKEESIVIELIGVRARGECACVGNCSGVGIRRTSPFVAMRCPWRIISIAVFLVHEYGMTSVVVKKYAKALRIETTPCRSPSY